MQLPEQPKNMKFNTMQMGPQVPMELSQEEQLEPSKEAVGAKLAERRSPIQSQQPSYLET